MVDLILKKRNGGELTREEIDFFIQGYTREEIPDYQVSALLMAIYYQGMTALETSMLTEAMVASGERVDLSEIKGHITDKHSTGGVGDKTTIVLAPLVASAGIPVAKMSGRGLGHTGGTIDKLESFSGFNVELERQQFIKQVNQIGVAVIGQSGNLTPADKKLYALRDVTATVESIPLIASSIMSKKIAAGADSIVLDVKVGKGAFMKEESEARKLAQAMVNIGKNVGRKTIAVISDMNQPLGYAVGNALEVKEAIMTLRGEGPKDLQELSLTLGAHMLVLAEKVSTFEEGYKLLQTKIANGEALAKLKELVTAQNGDGRMVDDPSLLPKAEHEIEILASQSGVVSQIECADIGTAAMLLGAGRPTKEAKIDLAVGIILHKKIGDSVRMGEPIATLHVNERDQVERVKKLVIDSIQISEGRVSLPQLILDVIV
jgi:pyrimidine-nucleoside phosphorylase